MEIVRPASPAELIGAAQWTAFLAAIVADGPQREDFILALAALFCGEPRRLLLCGNGPLVCAAEFNLEFLFSLCSTLSGRHNGGLDDSPPEPRIKFHLAVHRLDLPRLLATAEAEPATAFVVAAMDATIAAPGWTVAPLGGTAALPHPTLALLRWLHSEWNLADVSDRLAVIARWGQRIVHQPLRAVT
jgi:hypothetical protein